MNLPLSKYLVDWDNITTGDGTYSENTEGTSATVSAGFTTGRSYILKRFPVTAGDVISFKFLARRISGDPRASIDYPTSGQSKTALDIDSDEWMEYELQYAVPHTHNDSTDIAQCTSGVFTNEAGSAEIANPRISVSGGVKGYARVTALGLITLSKSGGVVTPTLNSNFHNAGILDINFVGNYLNIKTPPTVSTGALRIRPIFDCGLTPDLLPDVTAKIGQYNASTGEVRVYFSNGSGSFVDVNSLMSDGEIAYLWIRATGL